MSAEPKTIVVEISGPQASGKTTLAELIQALLGHVGLFPLRRFPESGRALGTLAADLVNVGSRIEVRETEYDDRDRELAGLRQERDRLRADVERLSRVDQEARFLVGRLKDYEADEADSVRHWEGHVSPSLSRLAKLLGVGR